MTQKPLLPSCSSLAGRQKLGTVIQIMPLGAMIVGEWSQLGEHHFGANYLQGIVLRDVKMP